MTDSARSNPAHLPFAASFDALAFIVKTIRDYPILRYALFPHEGAFDLVPALCLVFNSCAWDRDQQTTSDPRCRLVGN